MLTLATFLALFYIFTIKDYEPAVVQKILGKPRLSAAQLTSGDLYGICAPIEHLKDLNRQISPLLSELSLTPFFRTYRVNLERECPFWAQQRICNN